MRWLTLFIVLWASACSKRFLHQPLSIAVASQFLFHSIFCILEPINRKVDSLVIILLRKSYRKTPFCSVWELRSRYFRTEGNLHTYYLPTYYLHNYLPKTCRFMESKCAGWQASKYLWGRYWELSSRRVQSDACLLLEPPIYKADVVTHDLFLWSHICISNRCRYSKLEVESKRCI